MSNELRDLITDAFTELDPQEADNQGTEDGGEEALVENQEFEVEDLDEADEAEDGEEAEDSEESEPEAGDEEETDGEVFTVKVDGEKIEVTLDELKAGYQRQADYTRSKQALKRELEEFEMVKEEFSDTISAIQQLDQAWEDNPTKVIVQFFRSTDDPTQTFVEALRDLAANGDLSQTLLDAFGITPEIRAQLAQESEVEELRSQASKSKSNRDKELEEARIELEVQRAIAEFERQVDELIDEENLALTVRERKDFLRELASYAEANDLQNLKAAYKAKQYEESKTKKALAKKTVERAQAKKAASVSARSGAPANTGAPVQDTSDLSAVIMSALKDTQANLGS